MFVHLSSVVDHGEGRCYASGGGAGLQLDRRALRCRTTWLSDSLAAAAALTAQIRPLRKRAARQDLVLERRGPDGQVYLALTAEGWRALRSSRTF